MEEKPSNVTSIEEARKKKKKITPAVLFQAVCDAINRESFSRLPDFGERFVVYSPDGCTRLIGHIDAADVVTVHHSETILDAAIMKYCRDQLGYHPDYRWSVRMAKEARDFWLYSTDICQLPIKDVRWKSEPGLCFRRLPWDQEWDPSGQKTQTFEEFLSRCSNAEAIIQWVGSLFFEEADRQQYLWLHGGGADGKSAFMEFLAEALGPAAHSETIAKHGTNQFWTTGLLNRRLVYFADFNHYGYPSTGEFKALSGGDRIRMEPKGKAPYSAKLRAKFAFLSNKRPTLSSSESDKRRIIYSEVKNNGVEMDPDYPRRLWEEGGYFLSYCISRYQEKCPRHQAIEVEREEISSWIEELEQDYQGFFDEAFELEGEPRGAHGGYSAAQKMGWAAGVDVQKVIDAKFKTKADRYDFLAWMTRKYPEHRRGTTNFTPEQCATLGVLPTVAKYQRLKIRCSLYEQQVQVLNL